jgi:hypothetical protein
MMLDIFRAIYCQQFKFGGHVASSRSNECQQR